MALGTLLPFWPALLFAYLEPVSVAAGSQMAWSDPHKFGTAQVYTDSLKTLSPSGIAMAYQLGNIFMLLIFIPVVCLFVSRESRVAKAYLVAIAIGDLGHIFACYKAMGPDVFWDFGAYNDMAWGNIWFSAFLFVNRICTLLGLFGKTGR